MNNDNDFDNRISIPEAIEKALQDPQRRRGIIGFIIVMTAICVILTCVETYLSFRPLPGELLDVRFAKATALTLYLFIPQSILLAIFSSVTKINKKSNSLLMSLILAFHLSIWASAIAMGLFMSTLNP